MAQQKHIINKQILEIQLPTSADTFAVQEELSALCRQQLTTIMDTVFTAIDSTDESIQIEQLVLDLGKVSLANFAAVFDEKLEESFQKEVAEKLRSKQITNQQQQQQAQQEKTPLRAIAFYLNNGIVPWWAQESSKTFVQQQIAQLLQKPPRTFVQLVKDLRWHPKQQQRLVDSTTEQQKVAMLQLISAFPLEQLVPAADKFQHGIQQKRTLSSQKIRTVFWETAFQNIHKADEYKSFEQKCIQNATFALGIHDKKDGLEKNARTRYEMRTLLGKLKTKYPTNTQWTDFFKQVSEMMAHPFFDQLPDPVQKECMELLRDVATLEKLGKGQKAPTASIQPLATYLQGVQKQLQQLSKSTGLSTIKKLSSPFEDTDFITIENVGLVLFWPFLERFFENLGVMQEKEFIDETARHKAIAALQYMCDSNDEEWFEGVLPLAKLLCGLDLDEVVSPNELSEEEKEIAEGLLTAVIAQGPHWKNLSIEGFRTSYLCRPGSLRTRDGHWLLQVQRETHDITLEKLPWGFHTIKLPWMTEVLVVEWL